jgi:hypothetical protein
MLMLRKTVFFAAVAALCLSVGVSIATAGGGNSANAQLCQKGGWSTLRTSTGGAFKNPGDCVSYAAQGGVFGTTQTSCNGSTCTYTDPVTGTNVTAPDGALSSVTFGPPNEPYGCNSNTGPSVGAIATYLPNPNYAGPQPFNLTFRYSAAEVQAYISAHDHAPRFCLDKGNGFQLVPSCDSTDGQTPCVVSQGFEFADVEGGGPIDYAITVSVTASDPRGACGN